MKTAILFSGQGAQHPGMMGQLLEKYPYAGDVFETAEQVYGRDLRSFIATAPQEELNRTVHTQPCLLAAELAAWRVLCTLKIPYEAVLGFSLGEWAALAAAGVISVRDAFYGVGLRAKAMQRAVPEGAGAMAAVLGATEEQVAELCRSAGEVTPANYNSPGNITVAGTAEAVERLVAKAEEAGLTAARLAVSVPSHCAMMAPAAEELAPLIRSLPMREPEKLLLMNATGAVTTQTDVIRDNLLRQLTQPVRFRQAVEYLLGEGYTRFIELGPGKTLCGMVRRTAKSLGVRAEALPLNSPETAAAILALYP